jgi:hypothetical protein
MDKIQRIEIVNKIIKAIGERERRFFYSKLSDRYAYLSVNKSGKIFYHCEHYGTKICMSVPDYRNPRGWSHGGTLLGLVSDFCDFIKTGEDSNHNHGYGGLFCPHWGYSEQSMIEIRELAHQLGYLKQPTIYYKTK